MIKISTYILLKNYNQYNDFTSISYQYFISFTIVILLKGLQKLNQKHHFFIHRLKRKCHKIKNTLSIYLFARNLIKIRLLGEKFLRSSE